MNRLAAIAAALLLLAGAAVRAQPATAPPATVYGELPRTAGPTHYEIEGAPDAAALTFTGRESVDLQVLERTRELVVNAAGLAIEHATLAQGSASPVPLMITLDQAKEQARFTASADLAPGAYRLELAYNGRINRQPNGLFAFDYPDKRSGKTVRSLFTMFEAPSARQFAPLFDEPAYKATFDLSTVVPAARWP